MSWIITGKEAGSLGLLDQYGGAAAAYSLRSLTLYYTGPVVRVRRSSDNADQNFTATEVSDGTLAAWVGAGNDGFVRTWYDQSGNSSHAEQSTTSLQPRIVENGLLEESNNKPAIRFGASGTTYLVHPFTADTTGATWFDVFRTSDTLWSLHSTGSFAFPICHQGNNSPGLSGVVVSQVRKNASVVPVVTRADIYTTYSTGVMVLATYLLDSVAVPVSSIVLGSLGISATSFALDGLFSESIYYRSNVPASFAEIEANINAHYSIYP